MSTDIYRCPNGHESTCEEADVGPRYRGKPDEPMFFKCPVAGCNARPESQRDYFIRLAGGQPDSPDIFPD